MRSITPPNLVELFFGYCHLWMWIMCEIIPSNSKWMWDVTNKWPVIPSHCSLICHLPLIPSIITYHFIGVSNGESFSLHKGVNEHLYILVTMKGVFTSIWFKLFIFFIVKMVTLDVNWICEQVYFRKIVKCLKKNPLCSLLFNDDILFEYFEF
jgi:hypothetical protein